MTDACTNALERVYPFLDGELTWVQRAKVRWHLRVCPPCADIYDFEGRVKAIVHDKAQEDVPDDVVDRLKGFLREHDCDC